MPDRIDDENDELALICAAILDYLDIRPDEDALLPPAIQAEVHRMRVILRREKPASDSVSPLEEAVKRMFRGSVGCPPVKK
jgi:hypothetical protein